MLPFPFYVVLSPDERVIYTAFAGNESVGASTDATAAFKIGPEGHLTLLNHRSTVGQMACYLSVSAPGDALLIANYESGSVISIDLQDDGSLGNISSFHQHVGSSRNLERQSKAHPHCVALSPGDQYAFAADLGTDRIELYSYDTCKRTLTRRMDSYIAATPGSGPRHLEFHPNGRYLYAINELDSSASAYAYDAESGSISCMQTLSSLPADAGSRNLAGDLKVSPDGRFLYCTNRGHDSVAVFGIANDGHLTLCEVIPAHGRDPQNLEITPDGRLLLCANMKSDNLAVFHVERPTGKLILASSYDEIPMPSCISISSQRM